MPRFSDNRLTLTRAAMERLKPPGKGQAFYYDVRTLGLAAMVTAAGVKGWYFARSVQGRYERLKLGTFPAMSPEQARKAVEKITGDVAMGKPSAVGHDGDMKFKDLFALYIEQHAKPHKRTWEEDERQHKKSLAGWDNRRLSQVRKADVQALHTEIGKKAPYQANRTLALISKVFSFAAERGYTGGNPAEGVKRFHETSRDRFLAAVELKAFLLALDQEPDILWRDYFALLLWTGARRSNVSEMRWQDVDLDTAVWKIPGASSKNREAMVIVLSTPAAEILRRRAAECEDEEYVFPSHGKTGHIAEPKAAWDRILTRAGLKNVHVHDLRRTLGSWQAITGSSLPIIGRSLGHKSLQATQVYARLDVAPVRRSVLAATAAMHQATGRMLPVLVLDAPPEPLVVLGDIQDEPVDGWADQDTPDGGE